MAALAHRRCASLFLSILIALSVVLHLGQTVPAEASVETAALVAMSHDTAPCDSGDHAKMAHCSMIVACSLYAPLEASPVTFLAGKPHLQPVTGAVGTSWGTTPQLQPPQYSLPL
ncbi:hypothetical protein [Dongia sp.]|uniref:hypothetical protein n=1 Tax=Dongia sp. TaxID=1977262 RepID=UPI0037539317